MVLAAVLGLEVRGRQAGAQLHFQMPSLKRPFSGALEAVPLGVRRFLRKALVGGRDLNMAGVGGSGGMMVTAFRIKSA